MQEISSITNNFFICLFFSILSLIFSQIHDNYYSGILEEGNYDLLDVTDYHNINLVVSSSKNIYTGFPPVKKIETNANLINVTSLITINENFLLAACLQDSFLAKINLSTGNFVSLIDYTNSKISEEVEGIPSHICSLSNIDNLIFIGYTKIDESINPKTKTTILYKINISNKESTSDGPIIDGSIISLLFGESELETSSARQISCEPLKIQDYPSEYRLVCLHEDISTFTYYNYDGSITSSSDYYIYIAVINSLFNSFDVNIRGNSIESKLGRELGFRMYRINDTFARCMTGISLVELSLYKEVDIDGESIIKYEKTSLPSIFESFNADVDLTSYNNKFIFTAGKTSFMKNDNTYFFQINQNDYSNYFKLYNYKDDNVFRILGYYNEAVDKIIFLYQTDNSIKYFIIDNIIDIYTFGSYTNTFKLKSYGEMEYDLNELITNPVLNNLGNLNILSIKYKITNYKSETDYFGTNFTETPLLNNIFIPEPSLNDWKTYNLSFIDNVENEYTRIYYLKSLTIVIQTCKSGCYACWDSFDECTNCDNSDYAVLIDRDFECFPKDFLVEGHIYDEESNKFLLCYESCEFCSINNDSSSSTSHNCISCYPEYLYSYSAPGNCYLFNNLEKTEPKENNGVEFISATCTDYQIAQTGECIQECPTTSPYFSYEYNEDSKLYEKVNYTPPQNKFYNKCYEECPENSSPNENKECSCNNFYYKDNSGNYNCLPDNNCPIEFPYLNTDSKECFDTLEKCPYFFNDICYNNCPNDKLTLESQIQNIKDYYKSKLSLNNDLVDKICICDTSNEVWINNNENKPYYQECLSSCPTGYSPEEITNHCIKINETPTEKIDLSTIKNQEENPVQFSSIQVTNEDGIIINEPTSDNENDNDNNLCPVKYENRCYSDCPSGTCLTQDDPNLRTCKRIETESNIKVFNGICFEDFNDLTKNIKSIAENHDTITKESGIIIHAYSTFSDNKDNADEDYSYVDLGDCEYKLKIYYNLSNNTELFILGIDSPNKDLSSPVNVYNYGVYLEDGTLLDNNKACKESKILLSSPITNEELVKLDDAIYFSDLGYDIYDENSDFYNDNCASASINGNDIILSDRKKDFYPSSVSLCNDSCYYNQVDLSSKRFTCECDLNYNYSQKETDEEEVETEEEVSYLEYFLSLINYKIFKCYKLFLEYKSYYYNAGFYIAVGNLIICFILMIVFINCGIKQMNIAILNNVPNEAKLKGMIIEQIKKRKEELKIMKGNNPPKKQKLSKYKSLQTDNHLNINKGEKKGRKTLQVKFQVNLINRKSKKYKEKTMNTINDNNMKKLKLHSHHDSDDKLKFAKFNKNNIYESSINNQLNNTDGSNDYMKNDNSAEENIDNKEINSIPYTKAIRQDKRNYGKIFLSVIAHEIQLIRIFYYRHPFDHLSIILSQYIFELCLDLTLNCILYTEDVISEKYHNNGSIRFFTTLSLSFISNIISSIIAFIISKLTEYVEVFEIILNEEADKSNYYLSLIKFKKVLCVKLSAFYFIQAIINLGMCYYLMIFCTVYHNTQGSIMINYITGIAESMAISFGLSLITSIMRYAAIKCRFKKLYNTSKYFFENF